MKDRIKEKKDKYKKEYKKIKQSKAYHIISLTFLSLFIFVSVLILLEAVEFGAFHSIDMLEKYIESKGIFAPIVYCIVEYIAIVILIIPSTWGYAVGPVLFGRFWGVLFNCCASFLGSLTAFLIVRKWGNKALASFVPEKSLNKYYKILENQRRFEIIFIIANLFPMMPDNALAYIAGCSTISKKKFCILVACCKMWKILLIGLGADIGLDYILSFFGQ